MTQPTLRFFATVYTLVPETRWFHLHILRRAHRKEIIHTGPVESLESSHGRSGSRTTLTVSDVLDHLLFAYEDA